jgi:hypothetical protein
MSVGLISTANLADRSCEEIFLRDDYSADA